MEDTHEETLDSILRPLADVFDAGSKHWQSIDPASPEEYEPLRECIAQLRAEGSLKAPNEKMHGPFQLTEDGYNKYLPRIKALRVLVRIGFLLEATSTLDALPEPSTEHKS
jgi:hypothetical protein